MKLALGTLAVACAVAATAPFAVATPYASGVSITGNTVTFTLNEPTTSLTATVNGVPVVLNGATRGTKSFSVGSPTDTFSISAFNIGNAGYTSGAAALAVPDQVTTRFNSPRGVAVNMNPGSAAFGRVYVSNSNTGDLTGTIPRAGLTRGLYLLNADGTDALGQGNTARSGALQASFDATGTAALAPFRVEVGPDSNVYVTDAGGNTTTNGAVYRFGPDVAAGEGQNVLFGTGYTTALIAANQHGRIYGSPIVVGTGASATLYTTDGDFNTPTNSLNSLRSYAIGTVPPAGPITPTLVSTGNQVGQTSPGIINNVANLYTDSARGADGKFFISQNRSVGNEAGVVATDGTNIVFNSLAATIAAGLDGDTTVAGTQDLFRTTRAIAVSPDGTKLAVLTDNNTIFIVTLVNGVPDLTQRQVLSGTAAFGTAVTLGRDIGFDAAGNLYAVSSGAGLLRVLSPGGTTAATTTYDGANFDFGVVTFVPEPTTLAALAGLGVVGLVRRRKA